MLVIISRIDFGQSEFFTIFLGWFFPIKQVYLLSISGLLWKFRSNTYFHNKILSFNQDIRVIFSGLDLGQKHLYSIFSLLLFRILVHADLRFRLHLLQIPIAHLISIQIPINAFRAFSLLAVKKFVLLFAPIWMLIWIDVFSG